jgi:hypothetical protein
MKFGITFIPYPFAFIFFSVVWGGSVDSGEEPPFAGRG